MRAVAILLLVSAFCNAGTEPKASASEYPVHSQTPECAIGSEFWIHSFSGQGQTYVTEDYLVIEVAIFPSSGKEILLSSSQFTIRINGKDTRFPQTAGAVGASMKYSDWTTKPGLTAEAGPVILGRPQTAPRFPGDTRPPHETGPGRPQVSTDPATSPEKQVLSAPELAVVTALPEGRVTKPLSGFLYFAHRGKIKSIRTLDLVYQGPSGPVSLKLR
jgi:hypothetical protein